MGYEVIYSINYINMPLIIYIMLTVEVGIIVLLFKRNSVISQRAIKHLIFAAIFIGLFSIGSGYSHLSNAHALKVGDYKFEEGRIENFSPSSASVKGDESFKVNGISFEYSSSKMSGGLNHSISNYGIENGSFVKIYYKNGAILKIEIKH